MTFEGPDMREDRGCSINRRRGRRPGDLRLPRDRSRDPARHRDATRASRSRGRRLRRSIGRSPASTVVLTDFHLSGDHAQITQIGEHYVFRDLRSTNGSAVERDGQRIPIDATARWEIALADGDVLLLGNPHDPVRIAVRIGDEARRRARRPADRVALDHGPAAGRRPDRGRARPTRCASTRRCSRSARGSSPAR